MDAVELLTHDHRMVEQLLRDYDAACSDRQRRGVVEILIRELSKHAALEEVTVYPFARQYLNGDVSVDEQLAEHMAVKKILASLDGLVEGHRRERGLVEQLARDVGRHIMEEEGDRFPALRRSVTGDELQDLGGQLAEAKKIMPTRPHPAAPDRPPALTLAAPFFTIYDLLRDRVQGRPRT